ncbi:DUF2948 family protein [Candidatus Paracaedibacter symbiosus]|uniref:DUF2948 family protein n=1 Tax=Candidatus Paracaedibacter symbiosus TaxID=244582 RepID=UPI0018DDBDC1|nr:DUF2948 family protein [Candidatus Paracaedibacter symbiosus]
MKQLKLIAKDLEDLQILATHLQDSIVPLMSMVYDRETKTFRAVANRFCWEHGELEHEGEPLYHRVHSGFEIHHVTRVQHKGLDRNNENRAYNLLTIHGDGEGTLHLVFSGGPEVRLEIDELHMHLGDLEHPWPTRIKPKHIHDHLDEMKGRV